MPRTPQDVKTEMCSRLEQIDQLSKHGALSTTTAHDRKEAEENLAKQWDTYWGLVEEGRKMTELAHHSA